MTTYRGVCHAHTTYSDGEYTLTELRDVLVNAGYAFACMTDHAEYFDPVKAEPYRRECAELSDDRFIFVPGHEYECEQKMHILGFGCTAPAGTEDPQAVIRMIRQQGCLSVIAHPRDTMFGWIEGFSDLPDGIETWNSKYDSQYAPRPSTFDLLARLQQRRPEMKAYYGVDLHFRHQNRLLHTEVRAEALSPEAILAALARGDYCGCMRKTRLPSRGGLKPQQRARFALASAGYFAFRKLVRTVKARLEKMGATIPPQLRSQLRRIF